MPRSSRYDDDRYEGSYSNDNRSSASRDYEDSRLRRGVSSRYAEDEYDSPRSRSLRNSARARAAYGEYEERDYGSSSRGRMRHEPVEVERGNRRQGQLVRSERASQARHDPRGHAEDIGQGGWFGDPERHSRASARGWENPDHAPSGWFGDPEGHSEAAHRGWENPDHAPSGWFGDPEGHSRASRKGWGEDPDEERYRASRSRRNRAA